ncbi:MAG: hypothetical protein ACOYBE_00650 [Blautia sp.]
MGRAERRRTEREQSKKPRTYIITSTEIAAIKEDITKAVADELMAKVFGIGVMVIHDKFGQLMRKEVDGRSREQRYFDYCMELYDSYEQGYLTLDDIKDCLRDECGAIVRRG